MRRSDGPFRRYSHARHFERCEPFREMQQREPAVARLYWTPGRVSPLGTEDLVSRLRELGVDATRDAYLELARTRTSAWDLSKVWRDRAAKRLSRHDHDFLGVAACELWKRYCPEHPSIEMVHDWVEEGGELRRAGRSKWPQACDRWADAWEVVRARLEPHHDTCEKAAEVFDGTDVPAWIETYEETLAYVAHGEPRYALAGIRFCEQVLAQFPAESLLFRLERRGQLGVFHYGAGQPEEGERILLALIRDHPDQATGYVFLSDCLSDLSNGRRPLDLPRAIQLLEDALARPVVDPEYYDIAGSLKLLRTPRIVHSR